MSDSFADPLRCLNDAGVAQVVVGGLGAAAYGLSPATVDVGLVFPPGGDHDRAALTLAGLGYRPCFDDPTSHDAGLTTLLHADPLAPPIDLLSWSPVPWAEVAAAAERRVVAGTALRVASPFHLAAVRAWVRRRWPTHEGDRVADALRRTTAADRVYMAGEMALLFPDQLEAQRIREGRYGDRIPQALLDDPPPVVRRALEAAGVVVSDPQPPLAASLATRVASDAANGGEGSEDDGSEQRVADAGGE